MPQNRDVCNRPGHNARTQTAANNRGSARARTLISAGPGARHRPFERGWPASRWPRLCVISVYPSNILLPKGWPRPWTESWTGSPEHPVRREHSGTRVQQSVQVASPERFAGLLIMRRSGVRFPKAAQLRGLFSLVCSIAVDRDSRSTNAICSVRVDNM
jgi:hypothetical protein